jgi:hypothetical protein
LKGRTAVSAGIEPGPSAAADYAFPLANLLDPRASGSFQAVAEIFVKKQFYDHFFKLQHF